jgi:ATP-dependent phosphofructokinase / diphosphate-dependent phosphofructokinase
LHGNSCLTVTYPRNRLEQATKAKSMSIQKKRIALSLGPGFVPGLNTIIEGVVLAGSRLGWEILGIHDGFDGLLRPGQYPDGGTVVLTREMVRDQASGTGCMLGTSARTDPFRCRSIGPDNEVEEKDRSDELISLLDKLRVDALVAVTGTQSLSTLWKLGKKGLRVICIPKSAENDFASTQLSFGFNSALGFTSSMLDTAYQAAKSASKIGVVEVLGQYAGWLALQSGMSVCADVILIPEIAYDLKKVASHLQNHDPRKRNYGLVVVAEGAKPLHAGEPAKSSQVADSLKRSLSPLATGPESSYVIDLSGSISQTVAGDLQKVTGLATYPLALGKLSHGGSLTVVDRQLGLGYGAGAIRALETEQTGVLVVFQPPDLKLIPLSEAINRYRTIPPNSEFMRITRSLGISLGD